MSRQSLAQITGVLDIPSVQNLSNMIIEALAVLNGVGARGQAPGASTEDRAFALRTASFIEGCLNKANQLLADLGGIAGFIARVPKALANQVPIEATDLNLAGISILVECAVQIQEEMARERRMDIGLGLGIPTALALLGLAGAFA